MSYISSFQRLGRKEGQQDILRLLLEKRFGPLPPAIQARLEKATPAKLEAWADAVLDAPTLDGVFKRR